MIERLEYLDLLLLLKINACNSPITDEMMWWISSRIVWVPLYLFLVYLAYRKMDLKGIAVFLIFALVAVALSDLISVHLFKNLFLRYRPSHNLNLKGKLHFYRLYDGSVYKGGTFGFVSSHAANFGALLTCSWLVLRKNYQSLIWLLLVCGFLVCYSRVYLGVHYPSDVLVGSFIGIFISIILHRSYFRNQIQTSTE